MVTPAAALAVVACQDSATDPSAQMAVAKVEATSLNLGEAYVAEDLGTLGGEISQAFGVNDGGLAVGSSLLSPGNEDPHATTWQDGIITDLGTLGGTVARALDVNGSGQVVGYSRNASESERAFLWDGSWHDLGTLGGDRSFAYAINEAGTVVGISSTPTGEERAFIWMDGSMMDLGTLGGNVSAAFDINDLGQIVGSSWNAAGQVRAVLWADGEIVDLGTLGGAWSTAEAINNRGQVVGSSETASHDQRAFLWEDGIMRDLGTLGRRSRARDINDSGIVIGAAGLPSGLGVAFVWDGMMYELQGPDGGTSHDAYAISGTGVIAGASRTASNEIHATLWSLPSPADRLRACADLLGRLNEDGHLDHGTFVSLDAKLRGAVRKLESNDPKPAAGKLKAFVNEVDALMRSGRLRDQEGSQLISCVDPVADQA